MRVSLLPLDPPPSLRFFIRADGLHAGGITVHSVSGARFSYGIAGFKGDAQARRRLVGAPAALCRHESAWLFRLRRADCAG